MSKDINKEFGINYSPGICEDVIGITGYESKGKVVSYVVNDSRGILPHGMVNGSIVYVDTKADYQLGDLIIIKDSRNEKEGVRISKAVSKKEKDFKGKIFLVTTSY